MLVSCFPENLILLTCCGRMTISRVGPHESEFLVSPLRTRIVVPDIIPCISPFKEFRLRLIQAWQQLAAEVICIVHDKYGSNSDDGNDSRQTKLKSFRIQRWQLKPGMTESLNLLPWVGWHVCRKLFIVCVVTSICTRRSLDIPLLHDILGAAWRWILNALDLPREEVSSCHS